MEGASRWTTQLPGVPSDLYTKLIEGASNFRQARGRNRGAANPVQRIDSMAGVSDNLAIVLLSGGMDSCVTAALAAQSYRLAALHSDYGQRTETRERRAFDEIADRLGIDRRLVVDQRYMTAIGGSALTDPSIAVPRSGPQAHGIPVTYVPFRNAHFLAAAVSWAEALGAAAIFIGAVEQDSSGYPDCRPEYYRVFNELIETGTRPETSIRIETPLIGLSKAEIIRRGVAAGAPLELTWSCYQDEDVACGVCDSCALRLNAFAAAGLRDPIRYAASLALEKPNVVS
jgi:7-cyano-7-deazaguanine synthase